MIKILLLNTPCNGIGDIIFCIKISKYLKQWYNCKVTIATTRITDFMDISEIKSNIIELKTNQINNKNCRRFKYLTFSKKIPIQDLIFVTPLQQDMSIDYLDIRKLLDYSTKYNTFFFSEYNDNIDKKFTFQTGIGNNRLGLLLTDINIKGKIKNIKNKYVVIYITNYISFLKCATSFIEMVCYKYSNLYDDFDIIIPSWFSNSISNNLIDLISIYFSEIIIHYEKEIINSPVKRKQQGRRIKKTLNIRFDILPLKYKDMLKLYKNSEEDILLTGDQSITDVLSCCVEKNIFYQIVPWKEDFALELSKLMPNIFSWSCLIIINKI